MSVDKDNWEINNLTLLKMKLTKTLSCIATLLLAGSALHAGPITITQSDTHNATFSGIDFAFSKFDSSLGTLTGVSMTIYSIQNAGNFTVQATTGVGATVNSWGNLLSFTDLNGGSGLDGYNSALVAVGVSVAGTGLPYPVPARTTKTFTINSNPPVLVNNDIVPITGDYTGYQSSDGSGNAIFTVNMFPNLGKTGGNILENYTNTTANTTLTIAYTYTSNPGPVSVPEPSTVIVQMLIVAVGIWMFVRRRRAAAAQA